MTLTKEECIEYLETLKNFACLHTTCCIQTREEINRDKKLFNECINYFEQLINEHFDNLPLKFEELEKDMWVWDEKKQLCRYIVFLSQPCEKCPNGSFRSFANSYETELDFVEFQPNRFYRREVK